MLSPKQVLVVGLVAASALAPGVASAREDDDILAGDADSVATIFAADGTSSTEAAPYGTRAFVDRLVARGAAGGSYETDLVGDMRSAPPREMDAGADRSRPAGWVPRAAVCARP